jgi:hypothetical protein
VTSCCPADGKASPVLEPARLSRHVRCANRGRRSREAKPRRLRPGRRFICILSVPAPVAALQQPQSSFPGSASIQNESCAYHDLYHRLSPSFVEELCRLPSRARFIQQIEICHGHSRCTHCCAALSSGLRSVVVCCDHWPFGLLFRFENSSRAPRITAFAQHDGARDRARRWQTTG